GRQPVGGIVNMRTKVAGVAMSGLMASAGLTMGAPPADAAVIVLGRKCLGDEVVRCLEIHYDNTNHRYASHGSVTDVAGGNDYVVDLMHLFDSNDTPKDDTGDTSDTEDTAVGPLSKCVSGGPVTYFVELDWRARNKATGELTATQFVKTSATVCN